VRAMAIPAQAPVRPLHSRRLLALVSDDTLVDQIRCGNEAAFSVVFERYAAGILGFCRHMLGSLEAEDAVQHTFAAAFSDLARPGERHVALKPWLYTIAHNRCLSMLRARHEQTPLDFDIPTEGLTEQVERRAELRELLRGLLELTEDQRAALLLIEAGGLSHAQVAHVLGCEVENVKALVFRARNWLIQRREAQETACADIREQLATLSGNSLRRNGLRHHLRSCPGCRAYRDEVKRQRRQLRAVLPVLPSLKLKSGVLGVVGAGGGSAGSAVLAGVGAGVSASLATSTLVHVAAVGALLGVGLAAGEALVSDHKSQPVRSPEAAALSADSFPLGAVDAAGFGRPRTPGGVHNEPRAVIPATAPGGLELQRPGAVQPTLDRPDTQRGIGKGANAPDVHARTGSTLGDEDGAAGPGSESHRGSPTGAQTEATHVTGDPPTGMPDRHAARGPVGPPERATRPEGVSLPESGRLPGRGAHPERGGPSSTAPERRGPPPSGSGERATVEAAPRRPQPAPRLNTERPPSPAPPESAPVAAPRQAPVSQPAPPRPAEQAKDPPK
jgi:RNA polymerase sigma factor (sigma-70 family)